MQKWKSIHVFYHDINHKEIILCNVVAPFLKVLKEKGALEKWFFINYWEGGPHLRIRMLNMEEAQYDFLLEKMKEYIVKHPSSFSITREQYYHNNRFDGEKVNVTELPWYEDGSIIEIPYVPEIERYGGENAIAKAESMFCYSSQLAASLIQATVGDFNKRFSVAIDLFIEALFCSGCLTKQYLLLYSSWWGNYLGETRPVIKDNVCKIIGNKLVRIQDQNNVNSFMKEWGEAMKQYFEEIQKSGVPVELACNIVASQLHMMDNRLAVTPEYEYVIAEGILHNLG